MRLFDSARRIFSGGFFYFQILLVLVLVLENDPGKFDNERDDEDEDNLPTLNFERRTLN
jgi:hypothetical protein